MTSTLTDHAKAHGEVFTRRWVVDLMLDLAGYTPDVNISVLTAVEPSVGHGAFWIPMLERLVESVPRHRVAWSALRDALRGGDIQPESVQYCHARTVGVLAEAGCPKETAAWLADRWLRAGDFLLEELDVPADIVIGNPPYVRIENLPAELLSAYRAANPTMGGRADIFVGFYERGLDLLKPGGRLVYICADRWMRNAYGTGLRAKVVRGGYSMDDVIVMHDANAFDTEVSAYPAITLISRTPQGQARAARAGADFGPESAREYLEWRATRDDLLQRPDVEAAVMPSWHSTDGIWPDGSPAVQAWLEHLEDTLPLLENRADGTRLGIGVATGADKLYIRRDPLPDVEPSRLLPMVTPGCIKTGTFTWTGEHLVSPWDDHGVVPLSDYPKLRAYYEGFGEALRRRNVAGRSGSRWYRTIDRVNHALLERELLVMEDMKAQAHPVRVPAGYYPHHNLYWVVSDSWNLDALGGLLLSRVVEKQVEAYCVKMRGGTLRFQATVLRKVRSPRPQDIPADVLTALADAFCRRDREAATAAALRAYRLSELPA